MVRIKRNDFSYSNRQFTKLSVPSSRVVITSSRVSFSIEMKIVLSIQPMYKELAESQSIPKTTSNLFNGKHIKSISKTRPFMYIMQFSKVHWVSTLLYVVVVTTIEDSRGISSNISRCTHLVEIKECVTPQSNRANKY